MSAEKNHHHTPHKPWIRISIGLIGFFIVVAFFGSISHRVAIFRSEFLAEIIPRVLVDLTNRNRETLSINGLSLDPVLEAAAQKKADDMAEKGYFAHNSPDGVTPWFWFEEAGYDFLYAGENLAVHFSDSPEVVEAWMDSPSHRANIVNKNFTEIGIAISEGYFEGRKTVFVVQLFGQPKQKTAFNEVNAQETTPTEISEGLELKEIVLEDKSDNKTIIAQNLGASELEVLAEETEQDTKSVVENVEIQESGEVQGEKSQSPYSSFLEKLYVSPTMILTFAYIILGALALFLAFLGIISEAQKHHYHHIAYAVLLLILLLVMYFVSTNSLNDVEILGAAFI